MHNVPHRRQTIVIGLVVCAVIGALLRLAAPDPSALRDLGTLLLVLWLPVIGNVVAHFLGKTRLGQPRPVFAPAQPFTAHVRVALRPVAPAPGATAPSIDVAAPVCTLILANEGFTARLSPALAAALAAGHAGVGELEFLRPDVAVPRFTAGTAFHLLVEMQAVAQGEAMDPLVAPGVTSAQQQ